MKRMRSMALGILLTLSLMAPFAAQAASSSCYWWICKTFITTPNNIYFDGITFN